MNKNQLKIFVHTFENILKNRGLHNFSSFSLQQIVSFKGKKTVCTNDYKKNLHFGKKNSLFLLIIKISKREIKSSPPPLPPTFGRKIAEDLFFLSSGDQCNVNNIENKLENI